MEKGFSGNVSKLTKVKPSRKLRVMAGMIDHTKYKPLKGYLTISQIAKILGKRREATYFLIRRNGLQMIRIGDLIIVHKSQLKKLPKKLRVEDPTK